MALPERLLLPLLNHLLDDAPWATERLRPHAGAHLALFAGAFRVHLGIAGDGRFSVAETSATPDVTIVLPDDFAARAMVDRDSLLGEARLSGSADLTEVLAFVFRNLRWDAEADLARLVGDMAARRLHQGALVAGAALREAGHRLGANLGEYLSEENNGVTANRHAVQAFVIDVDRLRDDLARLEKRIDRL